MSALCLYFQVHQPLRIKRFKVFDIGRDHEYFNDNSDLKTNNREVFLKVSQKCYLPANELILRLLRKHKGFKVAYSFSGTFLEQAEDYSVEVLDSFRRLLDTGRVELLTETYYHSLAFFYSRTEFEKQVDMHRDIIAKLFGVDSQVFRNTELAYTNELAYWAENNGFKGILAEGWDPVLGWRSPNYVYRPKDTKKIKLLLKNYKLSDDIAFRFSDQSWSEWPLTAEKYAVWLGETARHAQTINLFMDYETFGEHQWEDSGIFDFLNSLPGEIAKNNNLYFATPSEVISKYKAVGFLDVPHILTWADTERDLSAWIGNDIQQSAIKELYGIEEKILTTGNTKLITDWRKLTTSDHFYYMCTKWFADGDVHQYFNPYDSPYDAYITFMNILADLALRAENSKQGGDR
ncbi:MAG: alpha-amylase [uncultured bacterium]|nr:MAG: alpha-amylase [uncultured bacterium]